MVCWRSSAARSRRWQRGRSRKLTCRIEKLKAQVRAKVEHPFHVVKNLFRYRKVRYRGLRRTPLNSTRSLAWRTWC